MFCQPTQTNYRPTPAPDSICIIPLGPRLEWLELNRSSTDFIWTPPSHMVSLQLLWAVFHQGDYEEGWKGPTLPPGNMQQSPMHLQPVACTPSPGAVRHLQHEGCNSLLLTSLIILFLLLFKFPLPLLFTFDSLCLQIHNLCPDLLCQ